MSVSEFKKSLSSEIRQWSRRAALIVIHGYNVGFEEAARRTAQIGFDLRVDGITGFFSWPSRGRVGSYLFDEEEVQIAEKYFVEFFDVIESIPDVDEINILAHSMGNRLLMRSIEKLAMGRSTHRIKTRVGQIVLAAADVSAELFRQHAHWYHALAGKRVTSYSCSQDLPLQSSRLIHGHHRVGLEPPVFLCSGVDSVSAAGLDLHALGHSYYADAEPLLYDIADLLHNDTHPDHRVRLEPATGESGNYWIFRK